jgi:O-antigen/teichoic acid export membrane protein
LSTRTLSRQAFILSGARCLAFALTALHPVVLTRILSKSDFGTYAQFYLIALSLIPLGEMGVSQGIYYFLPKNGVKKRAIAFQACLLTFVTGLVVCSVLLVLDRYLSELIGNPHIIVLVPFMAIYCFCLIASSSFEALMIADGNCNLASAFTLVMQLINSSALIGGALTCRSLEGIMTAICVASGLRLLIQYLYIGHSFGYPLVSADISGIGKTLDYVLPTGAANFIWSLQGKFQGYIVSALFSPLVFAVYSIGTVSLPFVGIITATAGNVMMPEISRTASDAYGRSHIIAVWNAAIRKMNLFLMPMFVFFFIMAEPFIVLMYTGQYLESVILFKLSLLNVLIASINNGALIGGMGESHYLMRLSILRIPLSFAILVPLTIVYGVVGAVLGNVLVTVLIILIEFRKVASLLDVKVIELIRWGDSGRIFIAALVACLPITIINVAEWTPVLALTVGISIYAVAYFVAVRVIALHPSEIDLVKKFCFSPVSHLCAILSMGTGIIKRKQ